MAMERNKGDVLGGKGVVDRNIFTFRCAGITSGPALFLPVICD